MKTIYHYLKEYGESDAYGFHMPGHKRNRNLMNNHLPYDIDITEIDGFDDLHHAEGIIQKAQERAAKLYHADETHFLVNGSTVGILSAILGVTEKGDKILTARNCHKSVYHAIYMNELEPVYLYPSYQEAFGLNGEIEAEEIEKILSQDEKIRAVMIVSPTYDGVVSDVENIAQVVHRYGIPLIVDEAHGAHFGFHSYFPKNANQNGADIVIHSVHKTLPSLTQTALLHMNGEIVQRERVRMYLHILQSSSPSYILMASIDECMELLEDRGKELFADYVDNLRKIRKEFGKLKHLRVAETEHYDVSKNVVSVKHTNLTSRELAQRLREKYHLETEMTAGDYVLAMTSVGDLPEGFLRLSDALREIDDTLVFQKEDRSWQKLPEAEVCVRSAEAMHRKTGGFCTWEEGIGKISMEYAYLYPPGIPILVPGERITEELAVCLNRYRDCGFSIEGLAKDGYIKAFREITI